MGTLALIGLGSNLGDRKRTLDDAVKALGELPETTLCAASSYHQTEPVGGPPGQGPYLNAAAAIETGLDPFALLADLHRIEAAAYRVRDVRWDERTLDLDLLVHGATLIQTLPVVNRVFGGTTFPLELPHPRLAVRRFVLAPVVEIAPEAVDPLTGWSMARLLANLDRRPSLLAFHDPLWEHINTSPIDELFPDVAAALSARPTCIRDGRDAYHRLLLASDESRLRVLENMLDTLTGETGSRGAIERPRPLAGRRHLARLPGPDRRDRAD